MKNNAAVPSHKNPWCIEQPEFTARGNVIPPVRAQVLVPKLSTFRHYLARRRSGPSAWLGLNQGGRFDWEGTQARLCN